MNEHTGDIVRARQPVRDVRPETKATPDRTSAPHISARHLPILRPPRPKAQRVVEMLAPEVALARKTIAKVVERGKIAQGLVSEGFMQLLCAATIQQSGIVDSQRLRHEGSHRLNTTRPTSEQAEIVYGGLYDALGDFGQDINQITERLPQVDRDQFAVNIIQATHYYAGPQVVEAIYRLAGWDGNSANSQMTRSHLIDMLYARYKATEKHNEAERYTGLVSTLRGYGYDDETILRTAGYFYGKMRVHVWAALAQLCETVKGIKKSANVRRKDEFIARLVRQSPELTLEELELIEDHELRLTRETQMQEHQQRVVEIARQTGWRNPRRIAAAEYVNERVWGRYEFGFVSESPPGQPQVAVWANEGYVGDQPIVGIAAMSATDPYLGRTTLSQVGWQLSAVRPQADEVRQTFGAANQVLRSERLSSDGGVVAVCVGPEGSITVLYAGAGDVQVWRSGRRLYSLRAATAKIASVGEASLRWGSRSFKLNESRVPVPLQSRDEIVAMTEEVAKALTSTSQVEELIQQRLSAQDLAEQLAKLSGRPPHGSVVVYQRA